MKSERRYRVYALLDPRKPGPYQYGRYSFEFKPFYVGKGTKGRAAVHARRAFTEGAHGCNKTKRGRIRKIITETGRDPIIVVMHKNLTEASAYRREERVIALIGRVCVKEGPLLNMAEGGLGGTGVPRKPAPKKLKRLLAETSKAAWERTTESERALREAKWRDTIASRTKKRQREVTQQCRAAASARWENASASDVERFRAQAGDHMRQRYQAMSDEDRIRFNLKRYAGQKAKGLGLSDNERVSVRPLIGSYIESMKMADLDTMKARILRKMTRLVTEPG